MKKYTYQVELTMEVIASCEEDAIDIIERQLKDIPDLKETEM